MIIKLIKHIFQYFRSVEDYTQEAEPQVSVMQENITTHEAPYYSSVVDDTPVHQQSLHSSDNAGMTGGSRCF